MKRMLILLTTLVALAIGASAQSPTCDIAGAWVGSSPAIPGFYNIPLLVTISFVPIDTTGKRFTAGGGGAANGDNTFGGTFPDADQNTAGAWILVRSRMGMYQFTATTYFTKSPKPPNFDRGEILYFWTLSGTAECPDANTLTLRGMLSLYSNVDRPPFHDQDKDNDGFADAGEVPFYYAPWQLTYKRLPLMTP